MLGPAAGTGDGFAVISEAVSSVTIVDATLVRYHSDIYGGLLAGQIPPGGGSPRKHSAGCGSSGTGWATTRTTRLRPAAEPGPGVLNPPVADWTWRSVREPALPTLTERGREWS